MAQTKRDAEMHMWWPAQRRGQRWLMLVVYCTTSTSTVAIDVLE